MIQDLPQLFRHHVFMCQTQRPPGHPHGSCGTAGAAKFFDLMKTKLDAAGLNGEIGLTATGCLGFCQAQPLMVVYPDGVWYRLQTAEDIGEIVETHFMTGEVVEHLAVVLVR